MPRFPSVDQGGFDHGLFTLTQIQHLMRIEFNRAERYRYPIICMVFTVDRLGHLRDLYGYDSKEEILRQVVNLLEKETRSSDYLGRLADDRLLAVVPHTGVEGAEHLAARVLASARNLKILHDGRSLQVSLSIGASHNQGANTLYFDALLSEAENAVSEASAAGGDRIVINAPGGPGGPGD